MESEERKHTGQTGSIYTAQVPSERPEDIVEQIKKQLDEDRTLVEQSDFVLITSQKNKSGKRHRDLD